ncbi:thiamine pyrophosphate-binding protein [Streptosporangium sp. NPDC004631]
MAESTRTTGTAMAEALRANGVSLAFGIPGTHNLEFYRGMAASAIQHVVTRHEQGAGYAADGYARSTGRPGVVVATSGPGVMNVMTAAATAYADSVPMLVLSPGVPTGLERSGFGWLHEMKDQRAAVDAAVARSLRPGTPGQAVDAIHETFSRWAVERSRPVHIEVPLDVLETPWSGEIPPVWPAACPAAAAPEAVDAAIALLGAASAPVIVAGGGAVTAAAALRALAERLDAPVVTTIGGKGVLDEEHPLAVGAFMGYAGAKALVEAADVLLVVGSELGDAEIPHGSLAPTGQVVRVDVDPGQLHRNLRATLPIHADARLTLKALLAGLTGPVTSVNPAGGEGARRAGAARTNCLAQAMRAGGRWRAIQEALRAELPADVIVTGDSSQVSYLGTAPFWRFAEPRRYLVPAGFSTLGYGLPAAIGVKLADRARPVLALLGDGALMFSVQELVTAAELGLALPIVVLDNHGFGEIRQNMIDRSIAPYAVDLTRPDFVRLAESMGVRGVRAADETEAAKQAAAALGADRPTLIVCEVGA